tara:strand:+ start:346 stop:1398 length:1053 start_codon:yes stop_codon:yes gene_type:complete
MSLTEHSASSVCELSDTPGTGQIRVAWRPRKAVVADDLVTNDHSCANVGIPNTKEKPCANVGIPNTKEKPCAFPKCYCTLHTAWKVFKFNECTFFVGTDHDLSGYSYLKDDTLKNAQESPITTMDPLHSAEPDVSLQSQRLPAGNASATELGLTPEEFAHAQQAAIDYDKQRTCGTTSITAMKASDISATASDFHNHKTMLCKFHPHCKNGANCKFAHGEQELRHVCTPCAEDDSSFKQSCNHKTTLCMFNKKGLCNKGLTCTFAHDESELRKWKSWKACPNGDECNDKTCRKAHSPNEILIPPDCPFKSDCIHIGNRNGTYYNKGPICVCLYMHPDETRFNLFSRLQKA